MTWVAIWVQVFSISENQSIYGGTHLRISHLLKTYDQLTGEKCYLVNKEFYHALKTKDMHFKNLVCSH